MGMFPNDDPDNVMRTRDYVIMMMSDQMNIPGGSNPIPFTHDDLVEVESIGRGSFGDVYRMQFRPAKRDVAVKRLRASNEEMESKSMKRLQTEVDAIRSASQCDYVVQFYGMTFHEGEAWICMELMDISLEHLYKTVKNMGHNLFDETTLGSVAVSTIRALVHMKNTCNIIHRDVKPSNILLNASGLVKLCDFGICGYLQNSIATTYDAGCRPYMAPERLSTSYGGYDTKSDVWSLGITLVETANFVYPYGKFQSEPLFRQLQMVVHGDPPVVTRSGYSALTQTFIATCLMKDTNSRPNFKELMKTPYFQHYDKRDLVEHVGAYVTQFLEHRNRFKELEKHRLG